MSEIFFKFHFCHQHFDFVPPSIIELKSNKTWLQCFAILQNAWQTKCPGEMVRFIQLAIPPGMEDIYNPIEDAALMARIGAKRSVRILTGGKEVGSAYELQNAETGTTFKLWWWSSTNAENYYCKIERK